jgi:hypothetical protein
MVRGWTTCVRFPAWQDFSLFTASRPALGPTQPPIQWVPGVLSPGVKQQKREADHSHTSSVEEKNGGDVPPLPHMCSWLRFN